MSRRSRDESLGRMLAAVRRYQAATDALDEIAAKRMGVNRTDSRCWDLLDQHGSLTAGRLAELAGLTTGAVTGVLDRLEAKGLVRRTRDAQDRRRVLVELTDEARRRSWEVYGPMQDYAREPLAGFTAAELERIADFLEAATEITDRRAAELRDG